MSVNLRLWGVCLLLVLEETLVAAQASAEWRARAATTQAAPCAGARCGCTAGAGIGYIQDHLGPGPTHSFELVVPHAGGGFSHYVRNNTTVDRVRGPSWWGPETFGTGRVSGVSLLQGSADGNLLVIATVDDELVMYARDGQGNWTDPVAIATGAHGQPAAVQGRNAAADLDVVVPLADGGLMHLRGARGSSGFAWSRVATIGTGRGYSSVALVQTHGRLEVVARSGADLWTFSTNGRGRWLNAARISAGSRNVAAVGTPHVVEGARGFALLVPEAGGLAHYSRASDGQASSWVKSAMVDTLNSYTDSAIMWSEYGRLEAVARRTDGTLVAFYFDGSWHWYGDRNSQVLWAGQVFGAEPCSDPSVEGSWSDPIDSNIVGIHVALLNTGKVLLFGFANNPDEGSSQLFDPGTGSVEDVEGMQPHAFCAGQAFLADGRLWVSGGHGQAHVTKAHVFDPKTQSWSLAPNRPVSGRWYPTVTRLSDGSVMTISGATQSGALGPGNPVNGTWQRFDGESIDAGRPVPPVWSETDSIQLYPWVFELPNGNVMVHSGTTTRFLLNPLSNAPSWSTRADKEAALPAAPPYTTGWSQSRNYPGYGTATLLTLSPSRSYSARILIMGGSGALGGTQDDRTQAATDSAELLDLGAADSGWQSVSAMAFPRTLPSSVLLPDGKVFVVGGSRVGRADHASDPVMTPELYDPASGTWSKLSTMRVPRLYHATALLLPDGRVATAGRDHAWNDPPYDYPEYRIEIFNPPYLFAGGRPIIDAVSGVGYGKGEIQVQLSGGISGNDIARAVLMAPAAATHGFDMNQRAVELTIQRRRAGQVQLGRPPNTAIAPPGDYMLFVLSNAGVPSVAKFVRL